MTKVRVSEETSNLSHSSNLISAIGLERLLTYLMRSIRVEGRTHSWVVESFLREQEREHFRAAREQPFLRARACFPRQNNSTEIEAKVQHTQEAVQHAFRGPYSHLCAQKSRQHTTFNSVRTVRILSVRTTYFWHRFRGGTDNHTQAVPYGFVQVRTVLSWHKNRDRLLCGFSGKFGTVFKAAVQPLMHPEIC
jgi:hypothetical protein